MTPLITSLEQAGEYADLVDRLTLNEHRECDIGRYEADVLSLIDRLAAPPLPSVSTDNGSRPQEAVPTEGPDVAVVAALQDLLVAVTYAAPARTFAGVLAYEARVPVEFVERADAALGVSRQQPADGCSSNEGAGQ